MPTFNWRLPVTLLILLSQPVFGQVTDTNALACGTANAIVSICRSINPALVTASQFYSSAPCLCYSSTAWAPGIFDHYHSLCYSYLSTASPAYVASATSINHGPIPSDPCRLVGNILTAPVTVTDTALSITQPTDVGYSACQSVGNVVNNCEQLSPGFSTQTDPKTLASCLCYSGLAWKPSSFDNAWSSCVKYYSTAVPTSLHSRLHHDINDYIGAISRYNDNTNDDNISERWQQAGA
ncbi:hypothetical protein GQ53DRAFT_833015 [Thozetella sp. PMI_491]|nr:hypothetical protein GQ53DRAFT_834856 [Thozetella sp. PMI_491]KAH8880841.1 hypothetical protein GQ53DRAFT_833015 [Thozetella sp. PMI_491]